jgi:DNA invertase Pin-like site-specific DNA recombinase
VVPKTKLDRLARSVPHARAIGDSLAAGGVRLSIGGTVYDPTDPMGKLFFNILATFAEFEVDLLRMRTRQGMAIARANGKLKGKPPKLSARHASTSRTSPAPVSTRSPSSPISTRSAARRSTARSHARHDST